MLLKNARIFINGSFTEASLEINNGIIESICLNKTVGEGMDLTGKYIIPALIDIHTHGCMGFDFSTASEDEIHKMRKYYYKNGITSILATTVSLSDSDIKNAVKTIIAASEKEKNEADIIGINLEGPYLSPKKCGAHDISLLKEPDIDFINSLGDFIKIVNVAPEYEKAFDFIKRFRGKVSVAHTDCDYDTALAAFNAGADHITHIFNAMNPLHHRNPSVIGAFFDSNAVAELICDGIHVHEAILRMMFAAKNKNIAVISDSMAATGLCDGQYKLGSLDVTVKNGTARLADGTLAGSVMNVYDMMKNLIRIGVKKEAAVSSVTEIPAKSINQDNQIGKIKAGNKANLLITDGNLNILNIVKDGQFS